MMIALYCGLMEVRGFNSSLGIINTKNNSPLSACKTKFQFLIRYYKWSQDSIKRNKVYGFNSSLGIINEDSKEGKNDANNVSIPH